MHPEQACALYIPDGSPGFVSDKSKEGDGAIVFNFSKNAIKLIESFVDDGCNAHRYSNPCAHKNAAILNCLSN
jgi:hypothetical protein